MKIIPSYCTISLDFRVQSCYNIAVEWEEVLILPQNRRGVSMSKFRNQQNVRYLQGLFYEQTGADKTTVVYTLKDEPHLDYPSLYQAYMTIADPTEYSFATQYLDGWEHWEILCECTWFKPYVARWRKELSLKIKSEALANIIIESKSRTTNSYQASKFLATGEFEDKPTRGKGRPSKDEVNSEAKRIAEDHFRLKEDFNRLQIKELN